MNNVQFAIEHLWVCCDTREQQDAKGFKERINKLYQLCGGKEENRPERVTLDFGDYTAKTYDQDGNLIDLSSVVRIERKMAISELIGNLLTNKERFEREFTKAQDAGVKMHLIVENGSYTKLFSGKYENHPFVNKNSVLGSFFTFLVRYDLSVHFCKPEQTADIMYQIFCKELENYLQPKNAHRFEEKHETKST